MRSRRQHATRRRPHYGFTIHIVLNLSLLSLHAPVSNAFHSVMTWVTRVRLVETSVCVGVCSHHQIWAGSTRFRCRSLMFGWSRGWGFVKSQEETCCGDLKGYVADL